MDTFLIIYKWEKGMAIEMVHADDFAMAEAVFNELSKNAGLAAFGIKPKDIYQITKLSND